MKSGDIAFLLIISPFFAAIVWFIYTKLYYEISFRLKAKKQRLMFSQLKKGDFVWRLNGNMLDCFMVKKVNHTFHHDGTVKKMCIKLDGCYEEIKIDPKNVKSYEFEDYYTLMEDAVSRQKLILLKRKNEVEKLSKASPVEIKKAVDNVIKGLEIFEKKLLS